MIRMLTRKQARRIPSDRGSLDFAGNCPDGDIWSVLPRRRWLPRSLVCHRATHVFEIANDQEVLGQLQKVVARHEDTLPDIGRMFDLGHDEIARANPDVDVWLPGAGTEILLPTQFVLPEAPLRKAWC